MAGLGVAAVLAAAVAVAVVWLARPVSQVRYVGELRTPAGGRVAASVSLRLDGIAPPAQVTVDLGGGLAVVAHKLR